MSLDEIDLKVLRQLLSQGRITWSELAGVLGLSPPATADRVRRLEDKGVIQGYTAIIDAESLGCDLTAFVAITLERPEHRDAFIQRVQSLPQVQECHHMAGDYDYLLKVRCRGTKDLERLVSDDIKSVAGVLKTRTMIALSTVKETSALPLPEPS
jgi:Lrp/AsnC family leucine-responsive transcriptional regulator